MGWQQRGGGKAVDLDDVYSRLETLESGSGSGSDELVTQVAQAQEDAARALELAESIQRVKPFRPLGEHVVGRTYESFDQVDKDNSSYYAKVENASTPPSSDWALLVRAPTGLNIIAGVKERELPLKLSQTQQINLSESNKFILTVDADRTLGIVGIEANYSHSFIVTYRFSATTSFAPKLQQNVNWRPNGAVPAWPVGKNTDVTVLYWTREGVLYGKVVDSIASTANAVALSGGFIQLLFNESSGLPQDTTGSNNHATLFDGTRLQGGGVGFGPGQHLRTAALNNFNPNESWWFMGVIREAQTLTDAAYLQGFCDEAYSSNYVRLSINLTASGTTLELAARNQDSVRNAVMQSRLLFNNPGYLYRSAYAHSYNAATGEFKQYILHTSPYLKTGLATSGKLAYSPKAVYSIGGLWRPSAQGLISGSNAQHDFQFGKQGLPTDSDFAKVYAFAKSLCASRSGANLP